MFTVRFVVGGQGARAGITEKKFTCKREDLAAIRDFNAFKQVQRIGKLWIATRSR